MQAIRTWWGQRFIAALEQFTDSARLARGRGYANENRIKSWKLEKGAVTAKIRGNVNPYFGVYKEPTYDTRIALKPIPAEEWALVIRYLGSRAAFVARLLLDQMPDNIEKPFAALDLSLLPKSAKDLQTRCSCPDYANPCKHVAGLCYFLAAQLDRDPFLLFELRGLDRAELFKQLRKTPLGKALAARQGAAEAPVAAAESYFTRPAPCEPPALADPWDFWRGKKRLPEAVDGDSAAALVPALLAKKGGAYPEFWQEAASLPDTLELVYAAIRKRAKEW
jgi:uncharacterized Zn finger protein